MTVRDLIASASDRLKRARLAEPRLEAESLLAHALGRDVAWPLAHPEAEVDPAVARRFGTLVARRARREPFAYVIGRQGFYGRDFLVTPATLIPRPETELLVETVLSFLSSRTPSLSSRPSSLSSRPSSLSSRPSSLSSRPSSLSSRAQRSGAEGSIRILDVGTGSGAIALTLAAELPTARVLAIDVYAKALTVAKANAKRLGVDRRVKFLKLDILKANRSLGFARDDKRGTTIVVANLPYLPLATWKAAEPEVRAHEPKLALVSPGEGLAHYHALYRALAKWKRKPSLLALEAEPSQLRELAERWKLIVPHAEVSVLKDLHGDDRVMIAEG